MNSLTCEIRMTYRSFEELPVWNAAIELAVRIFELSASDRLRKYSGFKDQIERATVSISNNIAEGFERGTTAELLAFLYIARGSAGEVRSMLCLLERLDSLDDLKSEISDLKSRALGVSRQLGGWAESLKNSDIPGTRYLDDRKRNEIATKRRRDDFLEELRQVQTPKKPSERPGLDDESPT